MDYYVAEIRNAVGTCIKASLGDTELSTLVTRIERHYPLEDGDQIIIKISKD